MGSSSDNATSALSVRVTMLGPLRLEVDGVDVTPNAPRLRKLVATLALNAGRVVSTGTLCDALWGERLPDTAHSSIQVAVRQIRRLLDDGSSEAPTVLVTATGGYQLRPDAVDAVAFRDRLARVRAAEPDEDVASLLRSALAAWTSNRVLDGDLNLIGTCRAEARALEVHRLLSLERLAIVLLRAHRVDEALDLLVDDAHRHTTRDRLQQCMCVALSMSGREIEAADRFAALMQATADRGLVPSSETRGLRQALLERDNERALDLLG